MAAMLSLPSLPHLRLPQIQLQSKLLSASKPLNPPPKPPQTPNLLRHASLPLTALTLPFLLHPQDALAAGGEFGILEGRSFALIHPIVMSGLFVYTLYAGYLGWQWRRVRTIQDEINELKKQIKPVAVTPDGSPPAQPPAPSPVEAKIEQLTQERKELIKGSYRDKHFNAGSILLGFGVFESIFGGLNTWLRTGKLFPGPHLFAGAGITILWAAAAALVPPMQKGSETARNLHIALNVLNLLLFIWQIPTGIDIVFKLCSVHVSMHGRGIINYRFWSHCNSISYIQMSTQPRPWVPFSFGGRAPPPPPRPTLPQQPPTAQLTSPQPSTTLAPTRPFVPPPPKSPQMSPLRNWILSSNKSPSHQIQTKPAASTEPPTTVKVPTPPPSPKVIKPSERAPPESPKLDKTRCRNDGASPTDKGIIKKLSHSQDKLGSSAITLAGENKGALMEVKPLVQYGKQAMSVSGEEGKSKEGIMAGYFNSNVQGLNNSIVCNGSIIYNDPGIHISVTIKPSRH